MAKMTEGTIRKAFNQVIDDLGYLPFSHIYQIMNSFANLKLGLYNSYKFVHLDFKLANIGLTEDNGDLIAQIIDFGSSCIEIFGLKIRSKSFMESNIRTSNCSPHADFALLVADIEFFYKDKLDEKGLELITYLTRTPDNSGTRPINIIRGNSRTRANAAANRNGVRRPRQLNRSHLFLGSYNYEDGKYSRFDYFFT